MINLYDPHRFISKSTLAQLAEVSPRTFARYLQTRQHVLDAMGVSPKTQKLPPLAVHYICEDYCIDLPPELQDQQALTRSPIYQHLIHALQNSHLEKKARRNCQIILQTRQSLTAPSPNAVPLRQEISRHMTSRLVPHEHPSTA